MKKMLQALLVALAIVFLCIETARWAFVFFFDRYMALNTPNHSVPLEMFFTTVGNAVAIGMLLFFVLGMLAATLIQRVEKKFISPETPTEVIP